jgi:hypothetical protein
MINWLIGRDPYNPTMKNETLCATFIEGAQYFLPRSNSLPSELCNLHKVKIEAGKASKRITFTRRQMTDGANEIDVLLMKKSRLMLAG